MAMSLMSCIEATRRVAAQGLLFGSLLYVSAIGCSSAPGVIARGEEWSRSYALSFDQVWTAVVTTLSDVGYVVAEQDRGAGRIRSESADDPTYRAVVLIVRVEQRGEVMRVGVQASGGASGFSADFGRLERAVIEFLDALDDRLRRRSA